MSYYRRPKTTQERKLCGRRDSVEADEYLIRIRSRRNQLHLPNSYDDIHNASRKDRSWKRFRKSKHK